MQRKVYLVLAIIIGISCKKNNAPSGGAALNIINAIFNTDYIAVNTSLEPIPFYQNRGYIGFGSSMEYSLRAGSNPLVVVSSNDTTGKLFSGTFDFKPQGIYSLYLAGSPPQIDTMFREDMLPAYSDSTAGVRFINLSPDSNPVTINLEGNDATQTEFTGLGYKQISAFKSYAVRADGSGYYNFEIHDQATGDLITTYTWSYSMQRSNTVIISGLMANGISIFQVNNF